MGGRASTCDGKAYILRKVSSKTVLQAFGKKNKRSIKREKEKIDINLIFIDTFFFGIIANIEYQ